MFAGLSNLCRALPQWRRLRGACGLAMLCVMAVVASGPARAMDSVAVGSDAERLDLTAHAERYSGRGDRLQIDTAPGPDGLAGRVEVKAQTPGTNPGWMVFALHNTTDRVLERWLVAERFSFIGSGVIFPDLDASRIVAVTPSQGFVPERIASERADIFQITIEPGQTVTLAAEMASDRFPSVNLWKPFVYESKQRERTLLNGILLGITGLLALFLTTLFAANHKVLFPVTGLLAWSVLALLCVDFGFWHRIFRLPAEDDALYRAAAEAAVAASLVLFLYTFLKLTRWHSWIKAVWLAWIAIQLAFVVLAPLDPRLAATFARTSFVVIAGLGTLFILFLTLANQDRALALLPGWILLPVWVFAAALAATGRLSGEFVSTGLVSGLVVILFLLGLIVTQFAFRSHDATSGAGGFEASQMRNYAIEGAGLASFEWNSRRNAVQTGALIEDVLGLQRGQLNCALDDWLRHVGPRDQDRLRENFRDIAAKGGGVIQAEFMMRGSDNSPHWFMLKGVSLPQTDPQVVRCVGLLRETTREKQAQDRIMIDAIRDHRTGLPNRELFVDRLAVAFRQARARSGGGTLALILFDLSGLAALLQEFDETNVEGALRSMLKRLQNALGPLDTVGRLGAERYGILLPDAGDSSHLAKQIESIRQAIRSPVPIGRSEQVLSANLGVALLLDEHGESTQLLNDAETALERAKRSGSDRFEVFRPSTRLESDPRAADAALLRKAMERKQISLLYQPIYGLAPERLAGFEALPRWLHPERGPIGLNAFMPIAEQAGFALPLAAQLLELVVKSALSWQKALPRDTEQLFVSVDFGSGLALKIDTVQELRKLLTRSPLPRGLLRLDIANDAVRENPEFAAEVLERLRTAGAGACLNDFGAAQFPIAHLPRLAVDAVKLDRWICLDALANDNAIGLLRGVCALARELGLSIQTDAMESPGDVAILRGAGCTLGSGPLYGEPLDDRQLNDLLVAVRSAERKSERRGLLTGGLLSKITRAAGPANAVTRRSAPSAESRVGGTGAPANGTVPGARRAPNGEDRPATAVRTMTEAGPYDEAHTAGALAGSYAGTEAHGEYTTASDADQDQALLGQPDLSDLAAGHSPATQKDGLARLQRGRFGANFDQSLSPVVKDFSNQMSSDEGSFAPAVPPTPFQAARLADGDGSEGNLGTGFPDNLPDADILRGLAARLEAALKRDRES